MTLAVQNHIPEMSMFRSLLLFVFCAALSAADLAKLRVTLLTDDNRPGRVAAFTSWLTPLVRSVTVVSYNRMNTPSADAFLGSDVVLLDWDQKTLDDGTADNWGEQAARFPIPLGRRETWSTPTVLLGSAGLMVGHAWRVGGDRGCTCLFPFAYDLREHPVTLGPLPIDRTATVEIPTPVDFQEELKTPRIHVLPLVDGPVNERHAPGWCVYLNLLSKMPEVEWISGGMNHKTVEAGAIWRQGNLLHFGFQQTPGELNANGRNLLANAIAYIADFRQDRPIARIRVGALGETFLAPRLTLVRWMRERDAQGRFHDFTLMMLADSERQRVATLAADADGFERWARERAPYLQITGDPQMLNIDEDLLREGITYDSAEFLTLVQTRLRSAQPHTAARLLTTYLPDCPAGLTPVEQAGWIERHRGVLFPTDWGDYRWYVDRLAFSRGKTSADCRGPARRDPPGLVCDPKTGECKLP